MSVDRSNAAMYAAGPAPKVTVGKIMLAALSQRPAWSHPSCSANNQISKAPRTKCGTEIPNVAPNREKRSIHELRK